jgi:hypothetical protein
VVEECFIAQLRNELTKPQRYSLSWCSGSRGKQLIENRSLSKRIQLLLCGKCVKEGGKRKAARERAAVGAQHRKNEKKKTVAPPAICVQSDNVVADLRKEPC